LIRTYSVLNMRKLILYSLSTLFAILLLVGCKQDRDIFDEPPAIRLNKALSSIDSTLVNSSNGWLMQYFPTSESPGYSLLVKFLTNGEVVVAAKNGLLKDKYSEARSLYDVIGDNGPVITFHTFNNVLHLFSNPVNPSGAGLEGDYEFVVTNYSDSLLNLTGKKRGTAIEMRRLPQEMDWKNFFTLIDQMNMNILTDATLYLVSGRDTFQVSNGLSQVFELQKSNLSENIFVPFIVTLEGIKFYEPFEISSGIEVQNFELSPDGTKLVAVENNTVFFAGSSVLDYFVNNQSVFVFDTVQTSMHYNQYARQVYSQMAQAYNGRRNIDYMGLSFRPNFGNSFTFQTSPTTIVANYRLNYIVVSANELTINRVEGEWDTNGGIFYENIPAIELFWRELDGKYNLSSTLSKNEIKFIDQENDNRFFVLKKR
jgi:hypothetical protein